MLYNYMGKGGEKNMHIMHLHRKEPEGKTLLFL